MNFHSINRVMPFIIIIIIIIIIILTNNEVSHKLLSFCEYNKSEIHKFNN
ncbi:MAG: hypothetical protein K7J15_02505 [Candidatus Regiella insecticola]|nr:hypothetical protein [Candidatus Regiella insecticola]